MSDPPPPSPPAAAADRPSAGPVHLYHAACSMQEAARQQLEVQAAQQAEKARAQAQAQAALRQQREVARLSTD